MWERGGRWHSRLWNMAVATSQEPARVFGELPCGGLSTALVFALLCEGFAIGSLAMLATLLAFAVAPGLTLLILQDPRLMPWLGGAWLVSVALLVVLHLVAGLCVELGAMMSGHAAEWRLGMRFGLYACGWDLVTSPAGIFYGLVVGRPAEVRATLRAAVRVPRVATRAYVVTRRQLGKPAQRRAMAIATTVLGVSMLLFAGALLLFMLALAGVTWPPM